MSDPRNRFKAYNAKNVVSQEQRTLPHWNQEGCAYFVTFRCADSLPQAKLQELQRFKREWLALHPGSLSEEDSIEYDELFRQKIDGWLDNGYGDCLLQNIDVARIVSSALQHFDQQRYTLDTYVVMPNHVHVLIIPWKGFSLENILHSWKSFTAKEINRLAGRTGEFWMRESYDHIVRSWDQLEFYRGYIKANPTKAFLKPDQFLLGQGTGISPK